MSPSVRLRSHAWLAAVVAIVATGCNAILGTEQGEARKEPPPSSSDPDAKTNEESDGGATTPADDGGTRREHPLDVACPLTIWSKGTTDPTCKSRRTTTLATQVHAPGGLAIERTRSGKTVAVYTRSQGADGSPIEIARFTDPKHPTTTNLDTRALDVVGDVALAKMGTDDVLLAYHVKSAGAVTVAEVGPKGAVRTPEDAATNLTSAVQLDVATNADGAAQLVYFDPTTKTLFGKTKKDANAAWSTYATIEKNFVVDGPAGSGRASVSLDDLGNAHVFYNKADTRTTSFAFYKSSVAGEWDSTKRILEMGGAAGYGISAGVFQEERFAAYFAPGSFDKERQLHFASWSGNASVTPQIIEEHIEIDDPLSPDTAVALAVDDFGWVHLVTAFPISYDIEIRYTRQAMIDGKLRFITDTVDAIPRTKGASLTKVALAVDERARPHILYHSGADDVVHYATIDDE